MKNFLWFCGLSFLLVFPACRKLAPAGTEVILNESYGTDIRNKMDVYLPEERDLNTQVVLLIHGGAWVVGDKSNDRMQDIRNQLILDGHAVVTMNYRYADGDFHNQMDDVGKAVEHIIENSGNWGIGATEFALMGTSAGGHLALLFSHAFDTLHVVKAVVSIVGPTDLSDPLFRQYVQNNGLTWALQAFLGATYQDNPQVYQDASPIYHYSDVPSFFIYGLQDNLVPYRQGVAMFDTLSAHGIDADTTIFSNAGHSIYGPNNVNLDQVITESTAWIDQYLN